MRKYRSELLNRLSGQQVEERLLKERERKKMSRSRNVSEESKARDRERKRQSRATANIEEIRAKERERKRRDRSLKKDKKNNPRSLYIADESIHYNGHLDTSQEQHTYSHLSHISQELDNTESFTAENINYSLLVHHNQPRGEDGIQVDPYDLVSDNNCLPHIISYDHYQYNSVDDNRSMSAELSTGVDGSI